MGARVFVRELARLRVRVFVCVCARVRARARVHVGFHTVLTEVGRSKIKTFLTRRAPTHTLCFIQTHLKA